MSKHLFFTLLLSGLWSTVAIAQNVEPTNAKELAEKKAAEEKVVAEKFAAWKATLSAEQQAWETVLEQNLGSFYLPLYQKDKVRGTPTAWDYVKDDPKLPRALLIGDSISRGYTSAVRKALAGKVNVHRAPENCGPVANGLKKLPVWLGEGQKWDVIHFNFGIHDRKTPLPDYEQRLDELATKLKATGAKIFWANTTPVAEGGMKDATPGDLVARNAVAAKVMQKHGIPVDDLYNWIKPDLAKYQNANDVHFGEPGYARLAERVARMIEVAAPAPDQAKNTAIVPVGKLETDGYHWEARHEAALATKEQIKPEIVMIGDSITHFWGGEPNENKMGKRGPNAWEALFGKRPVLNLGFGWDRTQNVLKRIELGELDGIDPKAVVIHIGTNNLAKTIYCRNSTPEEIAEAIGLIVDRVQAKCPNAQVILMAIFPRGEKADNSMRALLADINQRIAPLGKKPKVTFLDITAKWLQEDGSISKDVMPDFLHPNEKGYTIWADELRKVLPQ